MALYPVIPAAKTEEGPDFLHQLLNLGVIKVGGDGPVHVTVACHGVGVAIPRQQGLESSKDLVRHEDNALVHMREARWAVLQQFRGHPEGLRHDAHQAGVLRVDQGDLRPQHVEHLEGRALGVAGPSPGRLQAQSDVLLLLQGPVVVVRKIEEAVLGPLCSYLRRPRRRLQRWRLRLRRLWRGLRLGRRPGRRRGLRLRL
mmetsp:Transcript_86307/g.252516  ORF Transcript_86307/g.252516 Transcript_86307/m.252516 type:complete len:200 (-) Transcript_86307:347-946(-)